MTNLFTKHLTLHNFERRYNRIDYIIDIELNKNTMKNLLGIVF